MKDRCFILLNDFFNNSYDEKYILYTDKLTINQTIDEIINNQRYLV